MNKLFILCFVLAFFSLSGCGGEDISEKVEVFVTPNNPIVFFGDKDLGSRGEITGPYYGISFSVTNGTGEIVTINELRVKTTAIDDAGTEIPGSAEFDSTDFNFSVTGSEDASCVYVFPNFDDIPAGANNVGLSATPYLEGLPGQCPAAQQITGLGFFVGSLPGPETNVNNFNFHVEIEVVGNFKDASGTLTNRFYKKVKIRTR